MSNSLDPDQVRLSVGPDLNPSCLQRLSADDTCRQRVKAAVRIIADQIWLLTNTRCMQLRQFRYKNGR